MLPLHQRTRYIKTKLPEQDSNLQSRINNPPVYHLTDRGMSRRAPLGRSVGDAHADPMDAPKPDTDCAMDCVTSVGDARCGHPHTRHLTDDGSCAVPGCGCTGITFSSPLPAFDHGHPAAANGNR